jgi:RecA-family ATPase
MKSMLSRLKATSFGQHKKRSVVATIPLLGNLIHSAESIILVGARGVGKTQFGLKLSLCVAAGVEMPALGKGAQREVLYIDGETGEATMYSRLIAMCSAGIAKVQQALVDENLLLSFKGGHEGESINADIDTVEGQRQIEELMDGKVWLLVLDNYCSLAPNSFRGRSAESCLLDWIDRQKKLGVTVILIHHTNKSGKSHGSIEKENRADSIFSLNHHACSTSQKKLIEFKVEKMRNRACELEATVFELRSEQHGKKHSLFFEPANAEDLISPQLKEILLLKKQGLNQKQIANRLGLSPSMVCRLMKEVPA